MNDDPWCSPGTCGPCDRARGIKPKDKSVDQVKTVFNIRQCARCGENHDKVEVRKFALYGFAPKEAHPLVWTHWAPCPTNGDPILFIISAGA